MVFQFVFQLIQGWSDFVHVTESRLPGVAAGHKLAYGRVVSHDTHGLQFGRSIDGTGDEMGESRVDLVLRPTFLGEEPVDFQLPYCLQANPFCTDITGIGVLDGVDIHQSLGFVAGFLYAFLDGVYLAKFYHPVPIFLGFGLDGLVVLCQDSAKHVLFTLVFRHIGKTGGDVPNIFWSEARCHKTDIEHDTTSHAACQVAEALLDAIVLVIALEIGIVPYLRYEMHGAKVQHCSEISVYYISVFRMPRLNINHLQQKNDENFFKLSNLG